MMVGFFLVMAAIGVLVFVTAARNEAAVREQERGTDR